MDGQNRARRASEASTGLLAAQQGPGPAAGAMLCDKLVFSRKGRAKKTAQ